MNSDTLQTLNDILALEDESGTLNSAKIEELSLAALKKIYKSGEEVDDQLLRFLRDFDIRKKDQVYADYQIEIAKQKITSLSD